MRHNLDIDLARWGRQIWIPLRIKADHTVAAHTTATDPICPPSSESDSEYCREVYMVEQGGEPLEKTTEGIQREAEEEIAHAEHLARDLGKRKGHNSLQDDSGGLGGRA
jgi:hypothetical protein